MTTITAKFLVASSDKKNMLPVAADPKHATNQPAGTQARTSEKAQKAKFAEFTFRDCPKRGTSNPRSVDLGGVAMPKWA